MIVSAIAAIARHNVLGKDNQIPWHLPADMAYFKRTTLDHHVIMGRNSFTSMGRPLPKRTNIVISRDPYFTATGVLVARSVEEALGLAYDNGEKEAFIIGGGVIFKESIDLWDKLYLTEIDLTVDGDVFFPTVDFSEWHQTWSEAHEPDAKNEWPFVYRLFERPEAA